jgi:hypothetical protein
VVDVSSIDAGGGSIVSIDAEAGDRKPGALRALAMVSLV